jgi:hypothetical protein
MVALSEKNDPFEKVTPRPGRSSAAPIKNIHPQKQRQNAENVPPAAFSVQSKKIAGSTMQIDCKVFVTQLAWGIVINGIF